MTGLMNAAAFRAVARHALGRAARIGEESLLVCCSLPEVADEADVARAGRLRSAAGRLVEATRAEDVLGRTGLLELSALLPGTGEDDAALVAERLAALEVAIGWAGAPGDGGEVGSLLERARSGVRRSLKLS